MIKKIIISISFLLIIGLMGFYFFQEKFIFINWKKLDRNHAYTFLNTFEEVFIKTAEKSEVNALHFKLPNPKGIVLFCHGNKGNLTRWGNRVSYFLEYNYEVLVYDYRGYGKSTGNFNEEKMYKDALTVYNYLKKEYEEEAIVIYGFSLGTTFATKIASQNKPKELILEAPFFNLKKALKYYSKLAPTFLLKYQFRTDKDIVKVTSPITVFHGNKDQITSFEQSQELIALNTKTKTEFVKINEGTHHNIRNFELYKQKLKEILER